jgi:secreted PhoX family phosphatase
VSRIDLWTGDVQTIASRSDWSDLDGSVWTPWGTLLVSEEHTGGMIWEINPWTGAQTALPAVGLAPHEGIRFDSEGNLYTISEQNPGYIFKFTPDVKGDLSSGQLYALKVTQPTGDRVGAAEWVALDRQAVQVDAGAAATAVGATGYNRPEDVEISTSTGNWRGRQTMFVAVTGPGDNRVIAIDLQPPHSRGDRNAAYVYDYVKPGLNAPADFEWPDNVALDKSGNLYITEDPGGSSASGKVKGDDIWVAEPGHGQHTPASDVVRFATLTDADAEPTGIYFDKNGSTLFVNIQHRGGDGLDKTLAITPDHGPGGHPFTFGPGSSSVFGEGLIGQAANDHLNDVLRDVAE